MLSLIDMLLVLVLLPGAAAILSKRGVGGKLAWYFGTAMATLAVDSVATQYGGPFAGIFGSVMTGAILIALASASGRKCPFCRSGIDAQASKCPRCQSVLAATPPASA